MLKSLGIVYVGNAIGSLLLTVLAVYGHVMDLFNNGLAEFCVQTAYAKLHISFGDAFLKGILCNVLVGLAVWLAMSTKEMSGKILAMWPPIFVFAAGEQSAARKSVYAITFDFVFVLSVCLINKAPCLRLVFSYSKYSL